MLARYHTSAIQRADDDIQRRVLDREIADRALPQRRVHDRPEGRRLDVDLQLRTVGT